MANKSVQEEIKKLVDQRPRELLDTVDSELATQQNFEGAQVAIVLGLRELVKSYRDQANLVMESGARGKGSEATALRSTASALEQLATAVEQLQDDAPAERSFERVVMEAGLDEPEHGFVPFGGSAMCAAEVERNGQLEACKRFASHPAHRSTQTMGPGTPEGLDALVAERSSEHPTLPADAFTRNTENSWGPFTGFAEPTPPVERPSFDDVALGDAPDESEQIRAYLRGDTDVMPGDKHSPPGPQVGTSWPAHETQRGPVTDPEILKAAKVLEPTPVVFAAPAAVAYGTEPVIPGRRVTFVELRHATYDAPPAHTSNSQVTQMNDCGLQYRLARLEPGVIERPQWHLVGGKALHRAAETFEKLLLMGGQAIVLNAESLWRESFNTEIMAQVMACPEVPMDDWRAAGRGGSEGYTWWLTQGADMVQRYLDMRRAEPDRVMLIDSFTGAPILEHEGTLDVEGTPHKVVIDQAWRFGPNDIVIDDLKSGANAPRGGTFQLAQYAWYLHTELGFGGRDSKIYGRFWDARKGTYSAPVDLLELHPWDEIVWRIKDTAAKKDAGLFGPNPGPFCGGCAVKHACPVVTRG